MILKRINNIKYVRSPGLGRRKTAQQDSLYNLVLKNTSLCIEPCLGEFWFARFASSCCSIRKICDAMNIYPKCIGFFDVLRWGFYAMTVCSVRLLLYVTAWQGIRFAKNGCFVLSSSKEAYDFSVNMHSANLRASLKRIVRTSNFEDHTCDSSEHGSNMVISHFISSADENPKYTTKDMWTCVPIHPRF
jgi:hypothetical protein